MKRYLGLSLAVAAFLLTTGCVAETTNRANSNANVAPSTTPPATMSPTPVNEKALQTQALTLPVLDAFLANESFSGLLKSRLQLTDEQIAKLKEAARSDTARLSESNAGASTGETSSARTTAKETITKLIGAERAQQLEALIAEQGSSDNESAGDKTATPVSNDGAAPNQVPSDTRVVVNAPAYRMDVFEGGRLIKSYKIGIGYPQFPLPIGLRKARAIIFNPTWTPPDEPWVAKMKNVSAGEKVEAGSKLNPLGPIKIPIGGPSLIHGGKPAAKLGGFASHGCVGLTTPQVRDFAKILAQLGGAHLTDTDIAAYARDKTETKQVKLAKAIPVELRYETIAVEDGKLHIYRDVYDQDTNTEESLRAVLQANGVRFDELTEEERAQVLSALAQMSGSSRAQATPLPKGLANASPTAAEKKATATTTPRAVKNQKEIVIEIVAVKRKGYPAPVDLDTGLGQKKRGL
ncbi:MAG: L,D-transpeptidase ErfK/SrfK [Blastocatellia bacterium]|jgi:lipoprotein-anchoring transpeptidase ErfK/SrfK|nr:L,D-transpeptidase ErfK/SrfK [Blastocatellia bacterium]